MECGSICINHIILDRIDMMIAWTFSKDLIDSVRLFKVYGQTSAQNIRVRDNLYKNNMIWYPFGCTNSILEDLLLQLHIMVF